MNKYTAKAKANGELAIMDLSGKAWRSYTEEDPLDVYEYIVDGQKLYAVTGCCGNHEDMTKDELESWLEAIYDEQDSIETEDDD